MQMFKDASCILTQAKSQTKTKPVCCFYMVLFILQAGNVVPASLTHTYNQSVERVEDRTDIDLNFRMSWPQYKNSQTSFKLLRKLNAPFYIVLSILFFFSKSAIHFSKLFLHQSFISVDLSWKVH